jgi:hypothetical protein
MTPPTSDPLDQLPAPPARPTSWARPWAITATFARKAMRAGAWYPVLERDRPDGTVILVIRHRNVRVPERLLELRDDRPTQFTVVYQGRHQPNPAAGTQRDLGRTYAVCPASGHRVRVHGGESRVECPGCGYRGTVAWHETG